MKLEFDEERDCSEIDVVQDILVENFNDGSVLIWQYDETGDFLQGINIPPKMAAAVKAAIGADDGEVLLKWGGRCS